MEAEDAVAAPQLEPLAQVERIPMTKARSMIGRLINRVHVDKEHIVLEKSGMPVVAIIDIEEFKEFKKFLAFRSANNTR